MDARACTHTFGKSGNESLRVDIAVCALDDAPLDSNLPLLAESGAVRAVSKCLVRGAKSSRSVNNCAELLRH